MKKKRSLESIAPNLYGWLVWGGGFYFIRMVLRGLGVVAVIAAIFGCGVWLGTTL